MIRVLNRATTLAAAMAFCTPTAASAANIFDGGFEAQSAAITNSNGYCYFSGAYNGAACGAGGAWTGEGATSGLQFATNTAWPGMPSPDGTTYAFIQGHFGQLGSVSQTFEVAGGAYMLSWFDAGRSDIGGNQQYLVLVDGVTVFTGSTITGQAFTARTTNSFMLATGSHTVTFAALDASGDNTSFIDAVALTGAVPEPATWAMLIFGFGAIGGALRTDRRSKIATFA